MKNKSVKYAHSKIIFLDIDGVLNNYNSMKDGTWVQAMNSKNWEETALDNLYWLLQATKAYVVISSSWRIIKNDIHWWNEQFASVGLPKLVVGITPRSSDGFRGREVKAYVEEHDVQSYIILDDESDFLEGQPLVKINGSVGLTLEDTHKAKEMLNAN